MTYLKIGTTLVRASHLLAAAASDDDGILLTIKGGAEVYLDRDQAALFRAHLALGPGRGGFARHDVFGLGIVIDLLDRGASDPGKADSASPAPDRLRFH